MFILVPDIISSKLTVSVPSGTANGSDLNTTMKSVVFPGVSRYVIFPAAPLAMQVHVKSQVKILQTKFCKLAFQTVDTIQEMGLDVEKFQLRFLQLDVSQQHEYQQFIQCYFIELKPGTTVGNLLGHLSTHWDFFNCGLLKHVIDTYLSNMFS